MHWNVQLANRGMDVNTDPEIDCEDFEIRVCAKHHSTILTCAYVCTSVHKHTLVYVGEKAVLLVSDGILGTRARYI